MVEGLRQGLQILRLIRVEDRLKLVRGRRPRLGRTHTLTGRAKSEALRCGLGRTFTAVARITRLAAVSRVWVLAVSRPGGFEAAFCGVTLIGCRARRDSVKYRVVLERDPESGHTVATVPGLPGLFVDAETEEEALKLAKEGIVFYLEELGKAAPKGRAR